jgi:hypothetical protein
MDGFAIRALINHKGHKGHKGNRLYFVSFVSSVLIQRRYPESNTG